MKYIQLSHHVNEFTNKHGNVSICVPMFEKCGHEYRGF